MSYAFRQLLKMANLLLCVQWKGNPGDRIFFFPSSLIYETSLSFRMVRIMVKYPADVNVLAGPEGGGSVSRSVPMSFSYA